MQNKEHDRAILSLLTTIIRTAQTTSREDFRSMIHEIRCMRPDLPSEFYDGILATYDAAVRIRSTEATRSDNKKPAQAAT